MRVLFRANRFCKKSKFIEEISVNFWKPRRTVQNCFYFIQIIYRIFQASPLQPGAVFKFHSNIMQDFCRQPSLVLEKLKIGIHLKEIGKITLIFILQNAPLQYVISGFQKLTSKLFIPELELPDLTFFPSVLEFLCWAKNCGSLNTMWLLVPCFLLCSLHIFAEPSGLVSINGGRVATIPSVLCSLVFVRWEMLRLRSAYKDILLQ